jgi:hypothetical protein
MVGSVDAVGAFKSAIWIEECILSNILVEETFLLSKILERMYSSIQI